MILLKIARFYGSILAERGARTHQTSADRRGGNFVGGIARDVTTRVPRKAGYGVEKRFPAGPKIEALKRALAKALFSTVGGLTGEVDLMKHYLTMFQHWLDREAVTGEISQLIDPRRETQLDVELLKREFDATGYDSEWLGEGFEFDRVLGRFLESPRDAADEGELERIIDIALLRALVDESSRQMRAQERLAERLAPDLAPEDQSYLTGIISKLDRLPLGRVDPGDIEPTSAEREITLRKVYVALDTTSTLEEDKPKGAKGPVEFQLEVDKQVRQLRPWLETAAVSGESCNRGPRRAASFPESESCRIFTLALARTCLCRSNHELTPIPS